MGAHDCGLCRQPTVWVWWQLDDGRSKVLLDLWRPRLVLRALYQRVSDGVMELALTSGLGRRVMMKRSPHRRELWLKERPKDRDRAQRRVGCTPAAEQFFLFVGAR